MFLVLLYFALPLVDVLLSAEVSGLPGGDRLDCVKASDQCLKEQSCSTKYRTLRQCVAGKESNFSRATGLEAKDECRSAMEALKQKSLYNCRCKRGMKKEKNCLRIYWSMYQSLQGNDLLEDSPYEPVNSRLSDIFRLAPIVSGQLYGLLKFLWSKSRAHRANTFWCLCLEAYENCTEMPKGLDWPYYEFNVIIAVTNKS
ncbi:GDNF family receptor alpha-1-like protein [Willisornis vidua]|uniref:GDNF family receptor alpha-1-like protein n=1 Tax=Willisornis vidua TaxID=1566151 RepID=A0ABQ9D2D1_9PASS|nr:GDNF family receptor alpha-1-like protein [Willisornis vidua]